MESDHKGSAMDFLMKCTMTFYPQLARLTGTITAGLMLSHAVSCSWRKGNYSGWFSKSLAEWTEETGLTAREQVQACRLLRKLGVLEKTRDTQSGQMWFRVNGARLIELLQQVGDE